MIYILISKTLKVKVTSNMCKYYKERNYVFKCNDIIEIKIEDLPLGSNQKVEVQCDKCGKKYTLSYCDYNKSLYDNKLYCYQCKYEKSKKSNLIKYGCENPFQNKEIQKKQHLTNLEKYGCINPFSNKNVQEKIKKTMVEKYGVEHPMKCQEISKRCHDKVIQSLQKYGKQSCSRNQKYIVDLLNSPVNYLVESYFIDIKYNDNIYIEYNGSGHDISVKYKKISQKEFDMKEQERITTLYQNGWQGIIIEAKKDKLPSDEIIKNIIEISSNFLNENKEYLYILFDIDFKSIKFGENIIDYNFISPLKNINNNIVTTKESDTCIGENIV